MTTTETPYLIGASDVPAILGLSKWTTPDAAWARLKGLSARDEGSDATRRGQLLERAILWEYADREGVPYFHAPTCIADVRKATVAGVYQGPAYESGIRDVLTGIPWATARPDGYRVVVDDVAARVQRLPEVKTTRSWADWEAEDGTPILPPYYYVQTQWQMLVTGVKETLVEAFCVMDDSRRSILVPYKPKIAEQIFSRVSTWRDTYLLGDELPEEMTADIAGLIWPRHREPDVWTEPTDEARALVELYRTAAQHEKSSAADKALARDKLAVLIADTSGIDGLCTYRADKRGRRSLRLKGEE